MSITPTQEQLAIIEAALTGEDLRIQAFAGGAKTTTLTLVAEQLIKPSLYLAYNKAMAEEAKLKFPSHVEVRTTHSLAYAHVGHEYRHKLERPRGRYINVAGTGSEIGKYYKIKDIELSEDTKLSSAAIGLAIKSTVNAFEYSADTQVNDSHIPYSLVEDFKKRKGFVESTFRNLVVRYAKMLWDDRKDLDSGVLCTHDTYMKLFQLSRPKLTGYDVIYLDEAQDSNACLLDIFCNQEAQKIAVGDNFQAIYQWRGSVNAMEKLEYIQLKLSQSFRFGQQIGDIATAILRDPQQDNYVLGWDKIHSIASDEMEFDGAYTLLFRTNAALLAEAVSLLNQGKKLNIEVDMNDFVKLLTSALALYSGNKKDVKHESIVPFDTWEDLETESKGNGELVRVAKIVKDGLALKYIATLENHYNTKNPDITLTSAHKSKGREWDIVVLAEDFPSPYDSKGRWVGLETAERNLLYVAATRAKLKLQYNSRVVDLLGSSGNVVKDKLDTKKIERLLARKLSVDDLSEEEVDQLFNQVIKQESKGLSVRVKGIAHVDKYNIHKLPAFIDNNIGEHALDSVLRGIDELDMLEEYESGNMSACEAYDRGIIDELSTSVYSGDLYDKDSLGAMIDRHLMYLPS